MKEKYLGYLIISTSLLIATIYFYLIFISYWDILILKISISSIVFLVLLGLIWIGYSLVTSYPVPERF